MMGDERKPKRRKNNEVSADFISELPSEIIDSIVERLPIRDFARMSVLSQKWQRIWRLTPRLIFDSQFCQQVKCRRKRRMSDKFYGIVSSILFHHDGPILKFSLYVPILKSCPGVAQWVSFLSRSGVKDFSIEYYCKSPLILSSSSCLFSSFVELEKLKLHCCVCSPPPSFTGFRKLVSLKLHSVKFRTGTVADFIGNCPLLENLSLINCVDMEHVIVDAPKLRNLVVVGAFKSLCVKKPQNLVSVSIFLTTYVKICHRAHLRELIEALANSSKIEKLCLGRHFCKVLLKERLLPKSFASIKSLELQSIPLDCQDSLSAVLKAIQSCPNIEKLLISIPMSCIQISRALECNPDFKLHHLCHAKVTMSSTPATEIKLIEYLLSCSPALELLSLSFSGKVDNSVRSLMLMLLDEYPKASPKVSVIFPAHIISVSSADDDNSHSESSSDIGSESSYSSIGTSSFSSAYSYSDSDRIQE